VERVLAAFERFQHRLMSVHAAEFTDFDLTMAQAKLMYIVVAGGGMSLSEIAQRLGITLSTASGAVDRLVELGLLSRTAVPTNRRQVSVEATGLGIQTIEQFHELGARQMRAFLAHVPDDDLALVERAITVLANAVPHDQADQADASVPAHPVPASSPGSQS
jgi:DNA-binding MarR family transcriptional regulator